MKRDDLPLRARLFWWLTKLAERASTHLRLRTIEIWKAALARRAKRRERKPTPVRRWEAWYVVDGADAVCGNCGAANDNAGQLSACPTCGYEGKEISIG